MNVIPRIQREEEEDLDFNPILMAMKSRNWKLIVSLRIVRGTLWSALTD